MSARRRLLLIGVLMEAAYLMFLVLPFPLWRYYAIPLLDLGKITNHKPWLAVTAVVLVLFILYAVAYRTHGGTELGRVVLAFGSLFVVTLIVVYPVGALDIFDYVFFGREMATYRVNPYLVAPQDFTNDAFLPYVGWKWLPFTYGPVWALVSWGLSALGHDHLLLNLLLYKGFVAGAYLCSSILVYSLLRRQAPERAVVGTVLFAWNPLVVFEVGANGHNDILVALFLLLGVAAWAWGRRVLALGCLALSIFTKFVTAPLALIWLIAGLRIEARWRRRLAFLVTGALVVLILALLVYLPFVRDHARARSVLLAPLQRQELFTSSLPTLILFPLTDRLGKMPAERVVRTLTLACLLFFAVYQAWRVRTDWRGMAAASHNVLLFYLLFACLWFQPWYVLWVMPLAALIAPGRGAIAAVLFSLSALAKYLVFDFFWYWRPDLLDGRRIETLAVMAIYILPVAYLLLSVLHRQRAGGKSS